MSTPEESRAMLSHRSDRLVGQESERRPNRVREVALVPMLLRTTEVGTLLGLGRSTIFELLAAGELPTVRIGRAVRVPRQALEDWIRQRTVEPREGARRNVSALADPGHCCASTAAGAPAQAEHGPTHQSGS
jgi:excisionase family DNA binding protein